MRPVRLWTARNERTPPDALERLSRDQDSSVRWNVLLNPQTPGNALEGMAAEEALVYGTRSFVGRQHIVHHPNVPELFGGSCLSLALAGPALTRPAPATGPTGPTTVDRGNWHVPLVAARSVGSTLVRCRRSGSEFAPELVVRQQWRKKIADVTLTGSGIRVAPEVTQAQDVVANFLDLRCTAAGISPDSPGSGRRRESEWRLGWPPWVVGPPAGARSASTGGQGDEVLPAARVDACGHRQSGHQPREPVDQPVRRLLGILLA
ncbi:hypothetical protein, partial [Asanoa ishikariensis]|uniref:hypothetical protein n=1 Tax=Asanoa ishikariensis TaxID=137265 RepID=UPI003CC7E042